jgi:hypothetical protein
VGGPVTQLTFAQLLALSAAPAFEAASPPRTYKIAKTSGQLLQNHRREQFLAMMSLDLKPAFPCWEF